MGDISIKPLELQYKGLFDFDGLYIAIIDWAKNYGYMWHERDYKHKVPSPAGAEQEYTWAMTANLSEYVAYEIVLTVHLWDMLDMEVNVDGKKKSLTNGRLKMTMTAKMTTDWQKRFSGSPFLRKLGEFYYNHIRKKGLEDRYLDPLMYRVYDLHAIIKKYFDMQGHKYAYKGYLGQN